MMKKRCLALFCACLGLAGCGGQTPEHERSAPLPAEEETVQQAEMETGVDENGARPALSGLKVLMTIDETQEVVIDMYDNEGAQALLERLPLEGLIFADLDHVEKAVQNLEEPFTVPEMDGYDPIAGEMAIYRPWGNLTFFYADFRCTQGLIPIGKVESGLDHIAEQRDDFTVSLAVLDEHAE